MLHAFVTCDRCVVTVHFAYSVRARHTEVEHREGKDECEEAPGHASQSRQAGQKWKSGGRHGGPSPLVRFRLHMRPTRLSMDKLSDRVH